MVTTGEHPYKSRLGFEQGLGGYGERTARNPSAVAVDNGHGERGGRGSSGYGNRDCGGDGDCGCR